MDKMMYLGMRVVINDYRCIYDEFQKLATLLNIFDWKKQDIYDFKLKHGKITQLCYHPITGARIAIVRTDCGMVGMIREEGLIEEPKVLKDAIIIDVDKSVSYRVEWRCPNCKEDFYDDFEDEICKELYCTQCGCESYYKEKK